MTTPAGCFPTNRLLAAAVTALLALAGTAQATTVTGGSLLSVVDANQVETWLGAGEREFTNIFSGAAGTATSAQFHAAVDGAGPTLSIYEIRLADRTTARVGGYTTLDWGANSGFTTDTSAFLFNLTTGEVQFPEGGVLDQYLVFIKNNHFPTFGAGRDLFAGYGTLGTCAGTVNADCDGYSRSASFDQSQGQIAIAGDSGSGNGSSGTPGNGWSVLSLEVYTLAPAIDAVVPLPATLPLMLGGLALAGIGLGRRRR